MPYVGDTVVEMFVEEPSRPAVRGWCPSAHAPMETGDGWIVRARLGCRPVSGEQWAELADIATTFGNDSVEFTMRGNLQVRGVAEHLTGSAAGRLVNVGLAGFDEADDRRRTVVVNPLARIASDAGGSTSPDEVTARLEDLLLRHGGDLPSKWWAVVDADTAWSIPVAECDIALHQRHGTWRVLVGGRAVWSGLDPTAVAVQVVEACARLRRRARDLDPLSGLVGDAPNSMSPDAPSPDSVSPEGEGEGRPSVESWFGVRTVDGWVVAAAAPPLGVTATPALHILASMAARRGVSVHPTTERGVVVIAPPRSVAEVERCLDELSGCRWITDVDDERRLVTACIGSRGCSAALIDTWAVADRLIEGGGVIERVHVSGCSKRCGAPTGTRELIATSNGLDEVAASGMSDR